ncbi:MAG: PorT family protein [Bacteroidota bacterium]|nr:PorT family protein [Bacteroidota bacterium]
MSKNNWTDQLPELFEGYTEAEPEGLWDAVQGAMAPKQKKAAVAWWWYGAAALAAAACVAVGVFLFRGDSPVIPGEDSIVIPSEGGESLVAVVDVPDINMPESDEESRMSHPKDSLSSFAQPLPQSTLSSLSDNESVTEPSCPAATGHLESDNEERTDEETAIEEGKKEEEERNEQKEEQKVDEEDFWKEETVTGNKNNKVRKPTEVKLKAGVATGQYLAQDVSRTTTGYGLPVTYPGMPMMRAAGTTAGLNPMMLSRNKPSVTDAVHQRSSRFGITFGASIGRRWSVESGLYFTKLKSSYASESGLAKSTTEREMHYIGFPLHAQYKIWWHKGFSLYGLAGPMFETAYRTRTTTLQTLGDNRDYQTDRTRIKDNRWSLQAGAGAQLDLLPGFSFFLQPAFSWHIPNGSELENAYSEHPFAPEFFFAVRFTFDR